MEQANGKHDRRPSQELSASESLSQKRKLYAIAEREESSPVTVGEAEAIVVLDAAYDGDVDDVVEQPVGCLRGPDKLASERAQIYELFQPWALKTYGDQAKTKTITLRKKARILKALEGKEHSRPDSSKFRFWVKTKGFTTKRPAGFEEAPGSQRRKQPLPADAVLSDHPGAVDLFAASTSKDFGRRIYRKVACVEEFFDIIYNVHMELGGRSGMHAGQKRTYRIITETYAFLPREAVTRFLTICPECKKNLRPSSPATVSSKDADLAGNESSSELEIMNYSSHTESSLEGGPTAKRRRHSSADIKAHTPLAISKRATSPQHSSNLNPNPCPSPISNVSVAESEQAVEMTPVSVPKIRIKQQLQRPLSPPAAHVESPAAAVPVPGCAPDPQIFKSRDSLMRYYDFMRRFYAGGSLNLMLSQPVLAPPLYGSSLLQSLSFPTTSGHNNSHKQEPPKPTSPNSSTIHKFKKSPDSSPAASTALPSVSQPPHTPINLTKDLFSSSNQGTPTPGTLATSTPVAPLKLELLSPPKPLPELRIPQLRGAVPSQLPLPPLDLERLKPITSTYLQLTRSMGLSDEDALRFDNLRSY